MRKWWVVGLILVLLASGLSGAALAQTGPDPLVDLPGSLAADLGQPVSAPAANLATPQSSNVTVVLNPRNVARFEELAYRVQDPYSLLYRQFLSADDYERDFAPDPATFSALKAYFTGQGLKLTYESADRLVLTLSGTTAQLDKAFATRSEYRTGNFGTSGLLNVEPLRLPASLAAQVRGVAGFNHLIEFKTTSDILAAPEPRAVVHNDFFSLRAAYNFPNGLSGTGQTVGITLWAPPNATDLSRWVNTENLPGFNVNLLGSGSSYTNNDVFEANMDVQLVHTAAPGANIRFYQATTAGPADLLTAISSAINDDVKVLSNSWGTCEQLVDSATLNSFHTVFAGAATKGIPIIFSSGDRGLFDCATGANNLKTGYSHFPAIDPLVTAVGATTLSRDPVNKQWLGETGWSCSNDTACSAGGGGISLNYDRPFYQSAIQPPLPNKFVNRPTTPKRLVPDLSMNGDSKSGMLIYFNGTIGSVTCNDSCYGGGTSAAAPLVSGIMALASQNAGAPVGGINPFLYATAPITRWRYDIKVGYNGADASLDGDPVSGWDYTTGLGSIRDVTAFTQLILYPPLVVTNPSDNPQLTTKGTLSYALNNSQANQIILFNLSSGNSINVSGTQPLPPVKPGVVLLGYCRNSPLVIINGQNAANGSSGLRLQGNNLLYGLQIKSFPGKQILASGAGNLLFCTRADR